MIPNQEELNKALNMAQRVSRGGWSKAEDQNRDIASAIEHLALAFLVPEEEHHILELGPEGWALQHTRECRPNLLDCSLGIDCQRRSAEFERLAFGRYVILGDMLPRDLFDLRKESSVG